MYPYSPYSAYNSNAASSSSSTQRQPTVVQYARMDTRRALYHAQLTGQAAQVQQRPPPVPPAHAPVAGAPLHVCASHLRVCTRCRVPVSASPTADAAQTLNVVSATRYRPVPVGVPPALAGGRLGAFDWTVQLSDLPKDTTAWVFGRDALLAIIGHVDPSGETVLIRKPTGQTMGMTRVAVPGPGYVVDWILQAAPGQPDIGMWGWYRYHDGTVKIYTWNTPRKTPPVLVAWQDTAGHWQLHTDLAHGGVAAESATVLALVTIIIASNMGRGLAA